MSVLERLKKNTKLSDVDVLESSSFMEVTNVPTEIKMLNIAFSGDMDRGFSSGITTLAGESKSFKCVSGDTPIEVTNKLKKVRMTYRELHNKFQGGEFEDGVFVRRPDGELTRILDTTTKEAKTFDLVFDNGCEITAADRHSFMSPEGEMAFVENLEVGDEILTIHGPTALVSKKESHDPEVFDISIESPHWYVNTEEHGLIHHNTMFGLYCMSAYLKQFPDAIALFYDSEFGSPPAYLKKFGIDTSRVLHVPIKNIEELKFDLVHQLENSIKKGDRVFIFVDSLGNLASKKEVEDALNEKAVADMTRAKQLKSLFRMVTPYMRLRDIPLFCVQHTYQEQGMFPKTVVSGGSGSIYSSDNIFVIKKAQVKEGTQLVGFEFKINIEKSRYSREKSVLPVKILYGEELSPWAGLFDLAIELGMIAKPSAGWYSRCWIDESTGELITEDQKHRRKDVEFDDDFWSHKEFMKSLSKAAHRRYAIEVNEDFRDGKANE